ncbi:hypothetical protein [Serratia plymuthica]
MKVIDSSMLDQISGGRGNNGGDRIDNNGRANSAEKTAATGAGVIVGGYIGALVTGPGAPLGAAIGGWIGSIIADAGYNAAVNAVNAPRNNDGNGRGAFGGDSNKNSVNGQCHW